jgi:phosphatidylserine/phosphatidylglycerophosphate/cardiolipin synthase-like enzyme
MGRGSSAQKSTAAGTVKRGGPFMHLKAYEIDGEELRTGSANFSTSGENAQDNDLIVPRPGRRREIRRAF